MIIEGDSIEKLRELKPDSVDAVVTDPPYGLGNTSPARVAQCLRAWMGGDIYESGGVGFMGKSWDSWVPDPALWREVYRVLKPGGHAIVFAGSRTQDLMSIALRLAGFDVRDTLQWLYANGFPKSLNVSKAIDKQKHNLDEIYEVTAWIRSARDARGLKNSDIDKAFGFNGMGKHWTDVPPSGKQPSVPALDHVDKLLDVLGVTWADVPPRIQHLLIEINKSKGKPADTWFKREVVGVRRGMGKTGGFAVNTENEQTKHGVIVETKSATDEARKWEGWGTALKPAYEPVILVRKPPEGTVARNVIKHGVGALNIDATRIPYEEGKPPSSKKGFEYDGGGRWPANVLFDEEGARFLDNQAKSHVSRFFFIGKATPAEREAGLEGVIEKKSGGVIFSAENGLGKGREGMRANIHPTVKPIALMRYLCRLITPPEGIVLDPFAGSGTTLCAAVLEGFKVIGIEREPEYVEIAKQRLKHWRDVARAEEEIAGDRTFARAKRDVARAEEDKKPRLKSADKWVQLSLFGDNDDQD